MINIGAYEELRLGTPEEHRTACQLRSEFSMFRMVLFERSSAGHVQPDSEGANSASERSQMH